MLFSSFESRERLFAEAASFHNCADLKIPVVNNSLITVGNGNQRALMSKLVAELSPVGENKNENWAGP